MGVARWLCRGRWEGDEEMEEGEEMGCKTIEDARMSICVSVNCECALIQSKN